MKLKCFALFLFVVAACVSYAENAYILIGKNCDEERPVFVLKVSGDVGENIQVNENGEVYIKADTVVAIPLVSLGPDFAECTSCACACSMEDTTACGSRPSKSQKWQCPYCHFWWDLGERCQNPECPTNRWDK